MTRHWGENRKRYLLAILAIGGLLAAWYGFILTMDKRNPLGTGYQFSAYYCGLYFTGCLYASTIFSELSHKPQGINYLSVPASHLEKLCCAIFYCVILFFIVFTLIFYLVDIPMVQLANRIILQDHPAWLGPSKGIGPVRVLNIFSDPGLPVPDRDYNLFLLGYFAIQAAFILGSVYFTRYSFIKTTVSLLFLWMVSMLFIFKITAGIIPDGWGRSDLLQWQQYNITRGQTKLIRLPLWIESTLIFLLQYSLPIIFWFITYFRLKEKEV